MTVTRFPPSPTGYLHIGGARTALYSWLYARQNKGEFVLRIEDTDLQRSTPESVQVILEGMQWLGLDYDAGPFYQTERFDRYGEIIQQLLDEGKAYYCYCSKEELDDMREAQRAKGLKPRYDGRWRNRSDSIEGISPVVRFKNPVDGDVVIKDIVKGNIVISNQELDDLIIARADGSPTYNLTVVVDDMDMGITHVIRGDDHINNTPRQINILQALGADLPIYAHVPMILGTDGSRLSKRHGAVSVLQYRDEGYLPEALLNYLVRLGWSHGDQEIFTRQQMLELFRLDTVNKAASTFNPEKLMWVNQEHIKALTPDELLQKAQYYFQQRNVSVDESEYSLAAIAMIQERCKTLWDVVEQSHFFFVAPAGYDDKAVSKHLKPGSLDMLRDVENELQSLSDWTVESIADVVKGVVQKHDVGFAKVAQPVRIAITGNTQSPSIDQSLALLGRESSLQRLQVAIDHFQTE